MFVKKLKNWLSIQKYYSLADFEAIRPNIFWIVRNKLLILYTVGNIQNLSKTPAGDGILTLMSDRFNVRMQQAIQVLNFIVIRLFDNNNNNNRHFWQFCIHAKIV